MDEEKRALVLTKFSGAFKRYELRYMWYNPHDPWYLRYAKDKDFRGVRVIPVKTTQMTYKANRTTNNAQTLIQNCQRKWKIKFASATKSWTLYFQSHREFVEWLDLFNRVRELDEPNPENSDSVTAEANRPPSDNASASANKNVIQENWWESRYGASNGSANGNTTPSPLQQVRKSSSNGGMSSPILSRRAPAMLLVELPHSLGFLRLSLEKLDIQVITVQRFKERLFESLHLFLHGSALILAKSKHGDISDVESERVQTRIFSEKRKQKQAGNKYSKKTCGACLGTVRPMISRQMFHQEQAVEQGPDFFAFQVGSVFTTKEYQPRDIYDVNILNERFTLNGGLYRDFQQSSEDDTLLKSFEFVAGNLGSKTKPVEDCLDWVEDETVALSTLLERTAPNRPVCDVDGASVTTVVHLVLRPSRDVPVSRFFITVTRYTREFDALTNFSLYAAAVRHGPLRWEVKRRFGELKDLDSALRRLDQSLPRLPADAHRSKFVWKANTENDELRLIRELNVYLRIVISERTWDPPPVELLSFLGLLSTGKNDLLNNSVTRNRKVAHLDALSDLAEFGDIVLFRSVNPLSGLQRRVTGNCTFDHIGLVVKRKSAGYELLEATGEGVTSYGLEERLEAYFGGFCDLIALRKVRFDRTEEISRALAEFTNQVEGKPYKLSISKLAKARVTSVSTLPSRRKAEYFCSELVAEALRVIGVLSSTGRPDSFFLPHFFDEDGAVESFLTGGSSFDDIIFIDCVSPEVKFSNTS